MPRISNAYEYLRTFARQENARKAHDIQSLQKALTNKNVNTNHDVQRLNALIKDGSLSKDVKLTSNN